MPTFTVTGAFKKKDVDGKYGPMKVIMLALKGPDGTEQSAEWFTKAETPHPAEGSTIEGDISQGQYGLVFKKAFQPRAGGFGGGRSDSPETRRSIAMQHAQKCAVSLLDVASRGAYTPPDSVGGLAEHVKTVAAALYAQVQEAEAGNA